VRGLVDHLTGEPHGCDAPAEWEDGGDDGNTQSAIENAIKEVIEKQGVAPGGGGGQMKDEKPLEGYTIALTGTMSVSRNEMTAEITKLGGAVTDNVSRATILVTGATAGDTVKIRTANLTATPVLTEEQFRQLISERAKGNKFDGTGQSNGKGKGQGQGEGDGEGEGESSEDDELLRNLAEALHPYNAIINGMDIKDAFESIEKRLVSNMKDAKADLNKQAERLEKQAELLEEQKVIELTITMPDGKAVSVPGAHEQMPTLLKIMAARKPVFIVGPAGSGKTKAAELAAAAVGLSFYPKSVGPTTTEFSLMGYMDANGNYISGILTVPFEQGGVLLLDEMDSANPECLTSLNTALANDYCSFPDKVKHKHADFVAIASGNTYGKGADRQYVGRNQLDAATLNRFAVINWDYDKKLELSLAHAYAKQAGNPEVVQWAHRVHAIRGAAEKQGVRMIAGTRDILDGAALIVQGFTMKETEDLRFWNSNTIDTKKKILSIVGE